MSFLKAKKQFRTMSSCVSGVVSRRKRKSLERVTNQEANIKMKNKALEITSDQISVNQESSFCVITNAEVAAFFALLDNAHIRKFLGRDSCYKLSDKYLLAMVFVYFKRAKLALEEFTVKNFFVALYLANDMEEDDEDDKYEILLWTFGDAWRFRYQEFIACRDKLWILMKHRALVSRKTCEQYISISPNHPVWQRNRQSHHAGANRYYGLNCTQRPFMLFGPMVSPPNCPLCFPPSSESIAISWMRLTGLPDVNEIIEHIDKDNYSLFRSPYFDEE